MKRNQVITALAATLYTSYSAAVGGVAFNGDPLPTAEEFFADESKKKQADAWLETARVAVETFFPSSVYEPGSSLETQLNHATFIDKSLRQSLGLAVETLDLQASAGQGSRERSLVKTKLQEGAMWLGMNLGAIRETGLAAGIDLNPSPYPGSRDPKDLTINPPAEGAPRG